MTLDGVRVFCGEVRKAPGVLSEAVAAAECVLFDASDAFLGALDRFDAEHYPQTGAFGGGGGGGGGGEGGGGAAAATSSGGFGAYIDAPIGKDGRPVTGIAASAAAAAAAAPAAAECITFGGCGGGSRSSGSEGEEEDWGGAMMLDGGARRQ